MPDTKPDTKTGAQPVANHADQGLKTVRRVIERPLINGARYLTIFPVVGSLAGSLLMFILGVAKVIDAYRYWIPLWGASADFVSRDAAAIISVIEALDRFLIAIVLLYFANGVYTLFLARPNTGLKRTTVAQRLHRVESIGQLKQVVAEVILVILFVLFLRVALQVYASPERELSFAQIATVLALPVSTALLALALRLAELHPKPPHSASRQSATSDGEAAADPALTAGRSRNEA